MANTVNAALKPLETLSRIVNQPSSLFGSKSASSKNKSEQDAQGASQDSNSNQQDPGRESEPMDWRAGGVGVVVLWAWDHKTVLAWWCFPGNLLAFQRSVIVAWESAPQRIPSKCSLVWLSSHVALSFPLSPIRLFSENL